MSKTFTPEELDALCVELEKIVGHATSSLNAQRSDAAAAIAFLSARLSEAERERDEARERAGEAEERACDANNRARAAEREARALREALSIAKDRAEKIISWAHGHPAHISFVPSVLAKEMFEAARALVAPPPGPEEGGERMQHMDGVNE